MNEWNNFQGERWKKRVDVEDFVINNYKEYREDAKFLKGISKKTSKLWSRCQKILSKEEVTKVLDVETSAIAGIDNFDAGYIDKKNEIIVGLQTDEPLKRIVNPLGGIDTVKKSLMPYGFHLDSDISEKYLEYHKTYKEGIIDTYTEEILKYRRNHVISALPEEYGRGKVLGDYRRLALYGIDFLINRKQHDLDRLTANINFSMVRAREEVKEQIKALEDIRWMASRYGIDISRPASNAKEAFQWLYFAYLANIKQNNGVINSIGRDTEFLDIYIERDMENGILTEEEAQELVDQFVIKLRLVRHLRNNETKEKLIGEPTWVTESIGGMYQEETSFVTKTSYRFLNTLVNLGPSSEPNFTILWSIKLPEPFKRYATKLAIDTHVIQFVNDDLIYQTYGYNYAITGSSSPVKIGSQMIYYGGSCNLPKALLYAINGGRDEITGELMVEGIEEMPDDILDYQVVVKNFVKCMNYMSSIYADALCIVHYMQDKYGYESAPMAFLDTVVEREMSFGVCGISTVADSLSAIRYGKVKIIRDDEGKIIDYHIEKEFPHFGNNDERVDRIVMDVIKIFAKAIKKYHLYRNSNSKVSLQTFSENIYYGEHTGATPDGRKESASFAPGASAYALMDNSGITESLASISKIPFANICNDGVSSNVSIIPDALGKKEQEKIENFIEIINAFFQSGGEHLNVNVISKDTLYEAQKNRDKYSNLIVRYADCGVRFHSLNKNQQEEFISRTFHEKI